MSRIQVDNIFDKAGTGSPTFPAGSVVTGVSTATSFSGATGSFTGDVDIADKIIHTGDTNTAIRFPAADTFTVETAGSEALRVDSSGRLLLGTTTEGYPFADTLTIAESGNSGITIRSGTTNSGAVYFSDATSGTGEYDGWVDYSHNNRTMHFGVAATERLRITSAGEVQIASGNLKFSTAGKGIDFSATSDGGGMTSELLDDYEEGTFTPTAFVGTTALSVSGNTGTYTKVGNTVFFSCRLDSITKSGTGAFSIGGLPYTPLFTGNANKYNQPTVRFTGINPGGVLVPLFSPTGSQFIFFQAITTSGGLGNVTNTNLSSTFSIYGLSGFYTV
jgi:hypothetical protein